MAETCYSKYIDLGLPSGTLWAAENEPALYTFDEAVTKFKDNLPSKEQFTELYELCTWRWRGDAYTIIGPNGNSILLPATCYRYGTIAGNVCYYAYYWSSTSYDTFNAYSLYFDSSNICTHNNYFRCNFRNIRLIKQKETNNMNTLEIEIPDGKEINWEESKKQNKIVLKDKQLTYEDVCKKLFKNQSTVYYTRVNGEIADGLTELMSDKWLNEPNNAPTYHQLECILAKNKLANCALYLNDGCNLNDNKYYVITYGKEVKKPYIEVFYKCAITYGLIVFKTKELAQQAIEILGEETIKLALEPLGI